MEDKLTKMLGNLEYSELQKVKRDLDSGSLLIKHLVEKKIAEVETSDRSLCASCGSIMSKENSEIYTLLFGAQSVRKKASFCGTDCLHEFLGQLNDNSPSKIYNKERLN